MMTRQRLVALAPTIGVTALTACLAFAVGGLAGGNSLLFVGAVAFCVVGVVVLVRPALTGIVAMVSVFNSYRLGAGSAPGAMGGISYSDAGLAGATLLALPGMVRTPEFRRLAIPLAGLALYFSALLPTLILNHSHRSDLELFHRFVMVAGALVVGAWLTRDGLLKPALLATIAAGAIVGLMMIATGAAHGFSGPAEPLGLNKNYGGAIESYLAVVTLVVGNRIGIPRIPQVLLVALFTGATGAAHSRGSILCICVSVFVVLIMGGFAHSKATTAAVVAFGLALSFYVYSSVQKQMDVPPDQYRLGSLGIREQVETEVRKIWRTSPWDGVGLKYFDSGLWGPVGGQPANNVVDNELAESGIIGLVGFVMLAGAVAATGMSRRKEPFVMVGVALVAGHMAHGQVDIYWQAGLVPFPWIVLGMGLALAPPPRAPMRRPPVRTEVLA